MLKIKRFFKHTYQKLRYGFSDDELWNLDVTLAKYLAPRIKRFNKIRMGRPSHMSEERWDKILNEMQNAFEDYPNHAYDLPPTTRIDKAMHYLAKYYKHLWI